MQTNIHATLQSMAVEMSVDAGLTGRPNIAVFSGPLVYAKRIGIAANPSKAGIPDYFPLF